METLLFLLPIVYPPALFLLPADVASKINIGVKVIKTIANVLDKAEKTNGGLSTQTPLKREV